MTGGPELAARLRLMVITQAQPAHGRSLIDTVGECLGAGATAIQLRDKEASDSELLVIARQLRNLSARHDALFIVNDRFDLALAAGADGVHLGPDDLPISSVRPLVPDSFIIGYSTDDPDAGRRAAEAGASYLGVGAVYGTSSKPGLQDEKIGIERLRQVSEAVSVPAVGIGGVTAANATAVYAAGAGVSVMSAVMGASEPGEVVRAILSTAD
ncbi:MAG: thiamine phosphate synthase [Gemmatimonadota bacterium]